MEGVAKREVPRMRDALLRISAALDSILCEVPDRADEHLSSACTSDRVGRERLTMMPKLSGIGSLIRDINILQSEIMVLTDAVEEEKRVACTRNGLRVVTYSGECIAYLGTTTALLMQCNPLVPCIALAVGKGCAGTRMCTEVIRGSEEGVLRDLRVLREASGALRKHASWVEEFARVHEKSFENRTVKKERLTTFREETERYLRMEENRVTENGICRQQPLPSRPPPGYAGSSPVRSAVEALDHDTCRAFTPPVPLSPDSSPIRQNPDVL